ncbi:MAG: family 10 glycosylhydrolase, partial [Acetanaerobacterium sp.]
MVKSLVRVLAALTGICVLLSYVSFVSADTTATEKTLDGMELRGVFVDSFANRDFPSAPNLSEAELKGEIDAILSFVSENNLNTVFFKVCASGDALYDSQVFPVSYYLTGQQGSALSFDVLKYFVSSAHNSGIRAFAWIDPVRATLGTPDTDNLAALEKYVDPTQGYTPPQLAAARGESLPQNSISAQSPASK